MPSDRLAVGRLLAVLPALMIVGIVLIDLSLQDSVVLGLLVVVPLLASSVTGPLVTGGYGLAALTVASGLGVVDDAYRSGDSLRAQLVRLGTIASMSMVGVLMARYRLTNESRLRQMTKVAEAAQRAVLLPLPDRLGPVRIAVHYESAATDALVGGDLYGMVVSPRGLRVIVGDVRGKGLEAVGLAAQVLAAFRERATDDIGLGALMDHLDRSVTRTGSAEDFVTAVVAEIADDGTVRVTVAGHPAPVVVTSARARFVGPADPRPPLGLGGDMDGRDRCPDDDGQIVTVALSPGDRILLYTDGLTEARDPRTRAFLPSQVILGSVAHGTFAGNGTDDANGTEAANGEDVTDGVARLREAVVDWTRGALTDDMALVLLEYQAPPG